MFGSPFRQTDTDANEERFPLLRFFFDQYVVSFPFITNNTPQNQEAFWKDTVQPFVESVLGKNLSNSEDRQEHVTKRKQVNTKIMSGLLLFYSSMIVTEKDLQYLNDESHLKPSEEGKLGRINPINVPALSAMAGPDTGYVNGLALNIVSVKVVQRPKVSAWFFSRDPQHHYEFIVEVGRQDGATHYVARPYGEFKALEKGLRKKFPGIMKAEIYGGLPEKFKHDETTVLVKEKLRLSLRGFLKQLINFEDITNDGSFLHFIASEAFDSLDEHQKKDAEKRLQHEKNMAVAREEFLKQITRVMIDLTKSFDHFKRELIYNPNTLVKIFEEIGEKEDITNLSPLLSVFMEWCKIELGSTVFAIFVAQDNSNEMLKTLQKFHRAFPYAIVYNILRLTSPISIISKIISVFLITLPGTKNKTLLSIIFVMLLDEDINGYEKELTGLREDLAGYTNFLEAIENAIDDGKLVPGATVEENIIQILRAVENPTDQEKKVLSARIRDFEASSFAEKDTQNNDDDPLSKYVEDKDLAVKLKQFFQLKVRENDKLVLKLLWNEPELTQLLKNFLIIFYQPLIKLLSKAKMHIFFREFQKFVSELIELLNQINEEDIYFSSSVEIFNKLKQLFDKHIVIFWRFVHNMYVNDNEHLFINLIKWIENFLSKLRLKEVDTKKVTIKLSSDEAIDEKLFYNQLNERVDSVVEKRRFFKEFFEQKENQKQKKDVEKDWEAVNNKFAEYDRRFGLDIDELEEFNHEFGNGTLDLELEKKLQQLENYKFGTSELDKFDRCLVAELGRILADIESDI